MRENAKDTYGQIANKVYSFGKILTDHNFETRLKLFDSNLRLVFDNTKQRWTILEWALDNSGWNTVLIAQDKNGNEKPLGEWVFNQLFAWRESAAARNKIGFDAWCKNLELQAQEQAAEIERAMSLENQYRIRHTINNFRRGFKQMNNEPTSDVTAGYPKITRGTNETA